MRLIKYLLITLTAATFIGMYFNPWLCTIYPIIIIITINYCYENKKTRDEQPQNHSERAH